MAASFGAAFLHPGSSPAPTEIRTIRRLLAVAGTIYFAWWFVVEAVLPGSFNPASSRLVVVASFFLAFGASFGSKWARRHLRLVFAACGWLLTIHYYYLFDRNRGEMPWAIGAYVVVFAVGVCLPSRASLLAYSVLTLGLGLAVSLTDRALLHTIFLPGLSTMIFLSNLTLHNRIQLEQERVERGRVEAARAVAEERVALRDEFISIASHELRTPLASLQLAVQGLSRATRRAGAPPSAEALDRALEICVRQTTRLTRLVEGLLDASQIAAGRMALRTETVPLVEVAREVAETLARDTAQCKSTIEVSGDPAVAGQWDRTRIEQVVSNLLRNAIAFGLGRPIRVTVTAEGKEARLAVADEGIGISQAEQTRIFRRFERAVSPQNYGGMGLGLYVAAQIAHAHLGKIHLESEPGRGSTFTLRLPLESE
jgi:signal transduction histidine kinase